MNIEIIAKLLVKELDIQPTDKRSRGELIELLDKTIKEYCIEYSLNPRNSFELRKEVSTIIRNEPYHFREISQRIEEY